MSNTPILSALVEGLETGDFSAADAIAADAEKKAARSAAAKKAAATRAAKKAAAAADQPPTEGLASLLPGGKAPRKASKAAKADKAPQERKASPELMASIAASSRPAPEATDDSDEAPAERKAAMPESDRFTWKVTLVDGTVKEGLAARLYDAKQRAAAAVGTDRKADAVIGRFGKATHDAKITAKGITWEAVEA